MLHVTDCCGECGRLLLVVGDVIGPEGGSIDHVAVGDERGEEVTLCVECGWWALDMLGCKRRKR